MFISLRPFRVDIFDIDKHLVIIIPLEQTYFTIYNNYGIIQLFFYIYTGVV